MKKHEIVQMLVDKEAEEQGYSIEQRDAFMAGCDSIYDMIDGYKTIDGMMNWVQRLVPELKDDSKAYFVKMMLHRQADDYEVLIEELRSSKKNHIEMDKQTFGNLQMIRNYFGKNNKTPFEHLAFEVIDEIIKTNTPNDA